jgi:serine/threonine-protein kinase
MNANTASQIGAGDNLIGPVRAGEVVAEKYLIVRMLGVGGMGVVAEARDQVLDRRVAIKFLLPKLAGSETAVQRFVREARAATRVTSEHVVRLLEIEKLPSGTPFFVMEYLEGCDLRTLLRDRGALTPSLAVDYILQAVQALAEGHVRGVVHRDIKPSNLFLSRRVDGTPLIKVLDFGIAKTVESDAVESTSLTSSDDVRLGSPAYMPPEQLQNPRDVDTRSDIWSLGATLYELLCGRPPFEGTTYLDLASNVLAQPPKPMSEQRLPARLPEGLEQVLRRCLEKDREARYPNAAELAQALAPFGSADARMSLTRVSGMFASSSSFPALTRAAPYEATDCAPTLDVAGEGPRRDRHSSDPGPVATAPPVATRRSWLVIAAATLVIALVVALRLQAPPAKESFTAARLGAEPAAIEPPAAEENVDAEASEPPKAEPDPEAPKPIAIAPRIKVPNRAVVLAAAKPAVTKGAGVTSTPADAAATLVPAPSASAASPVDLGLGRSVEIERLIERRR